jgi:hypothetical protein
VGGDGSLHYYRTEEQGRTTNSVAELFAEEIFKGRRSFSDVA